MFCFMTSRRNCPVAAVLEIGVSGGIHLDCESRKSGKRSLFPPSAIGVRTSAHTACPYGAISFNSGMSFPDSSKSSSGLSDLIHFSRMRDVPDCLDIRQRNLVRPPEPFDPMPVHFRRASPTLWGPQHDHRPARPVEIPALRASAECPDVDAHRPIAAAIV